MPGHPRVVDDRKSHQAFGPSPGQGFFAGKKNAEADRGDEKGKSNEAHWLCSEQRAVRFGAISQPGAAEPMADPEHRGQGKVKEIERTIFRVRVTVGEPEND